MPRTLEEVFGSGLTAPAGEAWLGQPSGMLRVVALAAYARSPLGKRGLPRLLLSLEDPNAYVRMRSLQSVEQILGRKLEEEEYTLTGPPEDRHRQVEHLRQKVSGR
jgi:hypothetical protein